MTKRKSNVKVLKPATSYVGETGEQLNPPLTIEQTTEHKETVSNAHVGGARGTNAEIISTRAQDEGMADLEL